MYSSLGNVYIFSLEGSLGSSQRVVRLILFVVGCDCCCVLCLLEVEDAALFILDILERFTTGPSSASGALRLPFLPRWEGGGGGGGGGGFILRGML